MREKKVKANGKLSFQDRHVYEPRQIESWMRRRRSNNNYGKGDVDDADDDVICMSSPSIETTSKRRMIPSSLSAAKTSGTTESSSSDGCISEYVGPKIGDCPQVNYAFDSSFVVCRAKGALGADDLMKVGGSERRIADTFAEIIRVEGGWMKR